MMTSHLAHGVRCRRLWLLANLEAPPAQTDAMARLCSTIPAQQDGDLRRVAAALHVYRRVRLTPCNRAFAAAARGQTMMLGMLIVMLLRALVSGRRIDNIAAC